MKELYEECLAKKLTIGEVDNPEDGFLIYTPEGAVEVTPNNIEEIREFVAKVEVEELDDDEVELVETGSTKIFDNFIVTYDYLLGELKVFQIIQTYEKNLYPYKKVPVAKVVLLRSFT